MLPDIPLFFVYLFTWEEALEVSWGLILRYKSKIFSIKYWSGIIIDNNTSTKAYKFPKPKKYTADASSASAIFATYDSLSLMIAFHPIQQRSPAEGEPRCRWEAIVPFFSYCQDNATRIKLAAKVKTALDSGKILNAKKFWTK